jgi:hypothetical protein
MDGELAAHSCGGSLGFGGLRLTEFPLSSGYDPENLDHAQPIMLRRTVKRRPGRGPPDD